MLNLEVCQRARLSRDARFDGKFFTAVKTTKIYCRSICPATTPKEENVTYFISAVQAATAGFRPCLRCRPDSAPGSAVWNGVNTTLERAIQLINEGCLQDSSLKALCERLGVSDRYLRQLFNKYLGVSPKRYALYQQCLFAKQLLHQTNLPITQIAYASGFNSVRRFNDYFQSQLNLTPSQLRRSKTLTTEALQLQLSYRPPYDWEYMHNFLSSRAVPRLEWCTENSYGRTFQWLETAGNFTVKHIAEKNSFLLTIEVNNISHLKPIVNNIRRILDLDVDSQMVEQDLKDYISVRSGLRLPGIWSVFEAGIRAILGQQISVVAAGKLLTELVSRLGQAAGNESLFPTPKSIANSKLTFLKIPESRKQTLRNLAQHYLSHNKPDDPQQWIELKGIGPWTIDYARLRGLSDPDIYLAGDLGVKKAIIKTKYNCKPELCSPWQSYLTLHLWNQL